MSEQAYVNWLLGGGAAAEAKIREETTGAETAAGGGGRPKDGGVRSPAGRWGFISELTAPRVFFSVELFRRIRFGCGIGWAIFLRNGSPLQTSMVFKEFLRHY